jgi:HD-GYP domain-containing protein (c-di-GMP phosphodiesterase class II)
MAIPDAILLKPGPLSEEELSFVHRHTLIAERALLAAPSLAHVAGIVRSTHERWDGAGYPDGLAGEEIPLLARIIFVCDAYDAITSNRPYALSRTTATAVAELREHAGTQFEPRLVDALEAVLAEQAAPAAAHTTAAA